MLARDATRHLLNVVYERGGGALRECVNVLANDAPITRPFIWTIGFGGTTFRVPVLPGIPRTWKAARLWGWSAQRSLRMFYEWYLWARPAGVFVDVGANDGLHTYPFAHYGYRCVCVEPQDSCRQYMAEVCELNHFDRVTLIGAALSNSSGERDFFVSDSTWYSSFTQTHTATLETTARRMNVRTLTLDDLCRSQGVRPTIIKIDTELAELEVLHGGVETFDAAHPDAVVEVQKDPGIRRRVWDFFATRGYTAFVLKGLPYTYFREPVVRQPIRCLRTVADFDCMADVAGDYVFLYDRALAEAVARQFGGQTASMAVAPLDLCRSGYPAGAPQALIGETGWGSGSRPLRNLYSKDYSPFSWGWFLPDEPPVPPHRIPRDQV
jgi:FkbM family methyltransferase